MVSLLYKILLLLCARDLVGNMAESSGGLKLKSLRIRNDLNR